MFSVVVGSELKKEGSKSALWYEEGKCSRIMQYWHTHGKSKTKKFCKDCSDSLEDASQSGGFEQSIMTRRW